MRAKKNSKKAQTGNTENKRSNRQGNRGGGQGRCSQSGRGQGPANGGHCSTARRGIRRSVRPDIAA
jgi:hypothetical protein